MPPEDFSKKGLSFLIRASRIFFNCTASCQLGVQLPNGSDDSILSLSKGLAKLENISGETLWTGPANVNRFNHMGKLLRKQILFLGTKKLFW